MKDDNVVVESLVDFLAKQSEGHSGKYYPTIFIACGGTGAKIYERVRRLTVERFGSLDDKDLPGVAYVSYDTDVGSAQAGHQQEAGTTAGELDKLIGFRAEERLNLDGSRIRHYVESPAALASNRHIAEWFDPLLAETAKGMEIAQGAGQIRPIARLVAWGNRDGMVALFNRAYSRVTEMRGEDSTKRLITGTKVNVVICGSFAGGTGAGIFLDVAAMVRDSQPTATLTGMFLLSDVFASLDGDAAVKANGYASLAELNHYATHPYRVRWSQDAAPLEIPVLFDRVCVFGAENEGGQKIRRAADAYDMVGEALFLDFWQGGFAFSRSSVQVNRAQVLLQVHRNKVEVNARSRRHHLGASGPSTVETESYRQFLSSAGLARVTSSSSRTLNRLRCWLVGQVIEQLLSDEELAGTEALREILSKQRKSVADLEQKYARPNSSIVTTYVDEGDAAEFEELTEACLGTGAAESERSLSKFIDRFLESIAETGTPQQLDRTAMVRSWLETEPERFVRDLYRCAGLALRGTNGTTDWFGDERPALQERSIADALLARCGSADARELVDIAQDAFKRALPWINTDQGANVRGIVRDCYVVVPKTTQKNRPVVNAFFQSVAVEVSKIPNMNVARVEGSTASEFLIYTEASGLIPASIASLHGADGMAAAYKKVRHDRERNGVRSCVHLDLDDTRFADLVPLSVKDAEATLAAWRLLLLGVMLGVVTTKRNPLRFDALEAFGNPIFTLTERPDGPAAAVELGQLRWAIGQLTDDPITRTTLGGAVARAFAEQPVERYLQLLVLVDYYKTCIFPLRKASPDQGQELQGATLAYVALENIESETLAQIQRAKGATDDSMMELVRFDLPPVLWALDTFARPSGPGPDDSAIREGFAHEDRYAEIPAGKPFEHDDATPGRIRSDLVALVATFVPRLVKDLVTLNRDLVVYPWLALATGASLVARLPAVPHVPTLPPLPPSAWQVASAPGLDPHAAAQQVTTSADLLAAVRRELLAVQAHLADVRRERDDLRADRNTLRGLLREQQSPG